MMYDHGLVFDYLFFPYKPTLCTCPDTLLHCLGPATKESIKITFSNKKLVWVRKKPKQFAVGCHSTLVQAARVNIKKLKI